MTTEHQTPEHQTPEHQTPQHQASGDPATEPPPQAAAGVAVFAAVMLLMVGTVQALEGIAALLDDDFFIPADNYTYDLDVTAWGWVHLVVGLAAAIAGATLFSGRGWPRVLGITLASISLVTNFLWLPYYPVWALLVIAMNVLIIWGIATFDSRLDDDR